jgi:hypothetical protein
MYADDDNDGDDDDDDDERVIVVSLLSTTVIWQFGTTDEAIKDAVFPTWCTANYNCNILQILVSFSRPFLDILKVIVMWYNFST